MKKIFICFFVFFAFCCNVKADECNKVRPNHMNVCNSSYDDLGSSCSFESGYSLHSGFTNIPDPCKNEKGENPDRNYDFFILLDDSNSMIGNNLEIAINSLNSIIKYLKENSQFAGSKVWIRTFSKNKWIFDGDSVSNLSMFCGGDEKNNCKKEINIKSGTNTNFYAPLNEISGSVKKSSNPVLIFITDGYPTVGNGHNLGYLSSSVLFYDATLKFSQIANEIHNKENNGKEKNGKIFTIGINFKSENNKMAQYLLNPNEDLRKKLENDSNDETKRYYNLIEGKESKVDVFVGGIGSHPDYGLVGYHGIEINGKEVSFTGLDELKGKEIKKGIYIGPIKTGKRGNLFKLCIEGNKRKCFNGEKDLKPVSGNNNFKFVVFKNKSLLGKDVEKWIFKSRTEIRKIKMNETVIGGRIEDYFVDKFYDNIDSAEKINWSDLFKGLEPKNNEDEKKETISVPTTEYSGMCVEDIISLGNTVGYKYKDNEGKEYNIKNIKVGIVKNEKVSFNGGSLGEVNTIAVAGSGFPFTGVSLNSDGFWSFKKSFQNKPIISIDIIKNENANKISIINEDVLFDSIYDKSGKKVWNNTNDLINVVNKIIFSNNNEVNNNNLTFKALDSNDVTSKVEMTVKENKVVSNINGQNYNYKYSYTIPKATCSNVSSRSFVEYSGNVKNGAKYCSKDYDSAYYIPFGFNEGKFLVDVQGSSPVLGKSFGTTCKIKVSGGYPEDYVSYRSIDINNPFPKFNNKEENIPYNWRKWYYNKSLNQIRLKNSYIERYLNYKVSINKIVLNDNYNYSSFASIDEKSGTSKFVDNSAFSVINGTYCGLGNWNEDCDKP